MYESHPLSEKSCRSAHAWVDWLPEGKDVVGQLSIAFKPTSRVSVDKVAATRLGEGNRSYICRICKTAAHCFLWLLSNHPRLRTPILRRGLRVPSALARGLIGVPMRCKWRWPLTAWGSRGKMEARLRCETWSLAREAPATAAKGLSIRRGSCGTPPCRGKGPRGPANGAPTRLTLRNADGYHSKLDSE